MKEYKLSTLLGGLKYYYAYDKRNECTFKSKKEALNFLKEHSGRLDYNLEIEEIN